MIEKTYIETQLMKIIQNLKCKVRRNIYSTNHSFDDASCYL